MEVPFNDMSHLLIWVWLYGNGEVDEFHHELCQLILSVPQIFRNGFVVQVYPVHFEASMTDANVLDRLHVVVVQLNIKFF